MRKYILLVLAIALSCPAIAGNKTTPTLVVPKTSGLSPSAVTPNPTEDASFSGQVWVNGVFLAQWPDDNGDELHPANKIEVSIKLDEKEQERLPYYDWPEWKRTYIPNTVDVLNPEEAVSIVFSKKLSERILNKKVRVAKVHASFLLGSYEIGVECDAPWAHAKLISANVTDVAQTSNVTDLGGC